MSMQRVAFYAALFLSMVTAWIASAQDVTLKSRDGSVEVSGNLISFDGELYRLDTSYGALTLDASGVVCDGPGCPDLGAFVSDVGFSGSRTIGEVLLPALVQAFAFRKGYKLAQEIIDDTHFTINLSDKETDQLLARFAFRVSSTAEGFADLIAGDADLVLSMRPPLAAEIQLAKDAGAGNLEVARRSRIIGLDGLVPLVARANPLQSISMEQLAKVFSGEIETWAELGGDDIPIQLHVRNSQSGLFNETQNRILAPFNSVFARKFVAHDSNAALSDAVSRDTTAIGLGTFSEIGNARPVALKGPCGKVVNAAPLGLKTQEYPLTAPLYVYTPAYRLPWIAREFLSFVESPTGQRVVSRAGFVDLTLQESPVSMQGQRLANAILAAGDEISLTELQDLTQAMSGTEKLSLGFRFEPGGSRLDAQSRSSVEVLADRLESGLLDNRKVVFVGFSDGEGPASANLKLARRRAEVVRKAVLRAAPTADKDRLDLSVEAYGEAMPLACDDVEWGRQINRRVEVWIAQR